MGGCKLNNIEKRVREEVFTLFEQKKFIEGEKILRQLSFQLNEDHSTEIHRLVLRNLSWVNYKINNMDMAKKYAKIIKNKVDKDLEYQQNNVVGCCNIMNLYSEFFKEELTNEERLQINKANYECYHHDIENLDKTLTALNNIYLLERKFYDIPDIIEMIHMYMETEILEDEKKDAKLKEKLSEIETEILKDLEVACPFLHKELMETLFNTADITTAM